MNDFRKFYFTPSVEVLWLRQQHLLHQGSIEEANLYGDGESFVEE